MPHQCKRCETPGQRQLHLGELCTACAVAELDQKRQKVKDLNRRAQQAERAARQTVEENRRKGVSLGRQLAGWWGHNVEKEWMRAFDLLYGYWRAHREPPEVAEYIEHLMKEYPWKFKEEPAEES